MKLSTGLEPIVANWVIPSAPAEVLVGGGRATLSVPPVGGGVPVWVVSLAQMTASSEADRGAVRGWTVWANEPTVEEHRVELILDDAAPEYAAAEYEAHARASHNIPADAVVTDHREPGSTIFRRSIAWWEVTA